MKSVINPFSLNGKRILVTQSDAFMGPSLCEVFEELGATVVADAGPLLDPERPAALIAEAGAIDALVANLSIAAPQTAATAIGDDEWQAVFRALVDPLPRLVAAAAPGMSQRGGGRILVMGSATALRGVRRTATYAAARGAQAAYVQSAALDLVGQNIQLNLIAQNFVDNPTYFPPEIQSLEAFQARLRREVPLGRLVSAREDALFAASLLGDAFGCFVGQVFPVCGGWVSR